MNETKEIEVLIIGAGKTGTDIFNTIAYEPGISLVGVVDIANEFLCRDEAEAKKIPVFRDVQEAMKTMPDLIFLLAESGLSRADIAPQKLDHTEIIEDKGSLFFLNMIRQARAEVIQKIRTSKRPSGEPLLSAEPAAAPVDSPIQPDPAFPGSPKKSGPLHYILCIDGDQASTELLRALLDPLGYEVMAVHSGSEGLETAVACPPDLIILELSLPDMDGVQLCRELKENPSTLGTPLVILTVKILSMAERMNLAGKTEGIVQKSLFTAREMISLLRRLAFRSSLGPVFLDEESGLFEGAYFNLRLAQEISRADRHRTVFSILLADIDGFSEYARVCGTEKSSTCIKNIAAFLRQTSRGSDIAARCAIDEFGMLLTSTTDEGAAIVAERLLSFVDNYPFPGVTALRQGKLTASIGIVQYDRLGPATAERAMAEARKLIAEAKQGGGGCAKVFGRGQVRQTDPELAGIFEPGG